MSLPLMTLYVRNVCAHGQRPQTTEDVQSWIQLPTVELLVLILVILLRSILKLMHLVPLTKNFYSRSAIALNWLHEENSLLII
jgi:hypothetical protein